ncbi:DEKNAAC103439 [Brettanomyces naardenensis]|uniref:Phospholipid-transporting ATPase n=1 Tax=Brettanomyces naardenensis TaxID=13370 RepID=A0A448YP09_BRENA|nr:DEKNAAC103439 [Brettanomyces naardenensis]
MPSIQSYLTGLFRKPEPPQESRQIFVNEPLPQELLDEKGLPKQKFPENKVNTTKFTAWNFLPKDLALQFMNIANCYFLFIIILGAFQIFGVQSPAMQCVPLVIIIVLTATKDAIEDFRRAKSDHEMNTSRVHMLVGMENPNVVVAELNVWNRLSAWLSRKVWAMNDDVAKRIRGRKGKSVVERRERQDSDVIKSRIENQAVSAATASNPQGDDGSIVSAVSDLRLYPTRVSEVSGVGSLAPQRTSISTVRGTGKVSKFVPSTVSNPSVKPVGNYRFRNTYWQYVNVGDIVRVRENEEIPSDVVILSSSDKKGLCYVETKNLDGETNLKPKQVLQCGRGLKHASDFERAAFSVETEAPTRNLYKFRGVIRYRSFESEDDLVGTDQSEAISYDNVLLRGCILRNADWVLCCVLATGKDTKIMLNSGKTPSKRSRMAKGLNVFVLTNFALLFVMCFAAGLINGLFYRQKNTSRTFFEYEPYAGWSPAANGAVDFFVNLILYQTLVPISLYITIEIIKAFQTFFIYSDVGMYYEELDMPCTPKSWSISDDLGQIEYVFSDKTGTLTQNVMEFKKCTVDGKQYGISYTDAEQGLDKKQGVDVGSKLIQKQKQIAEDRKEMLEELKKVNNDQFREDKLTFVSSSFVRDLHASPGGKNEEFMLALALCHNVMTGKGPDGIIEYKAESPDESALVSVARDMGIVFRDTGRDGQIITRFGGKLENYRLLQSIPFNSTRKRMSVIIQFPDGKIVLYCKGADNVIFERLKADPSNEELAAKTAIHLGEFAEEGLRTLCVAKRDLSEQEFSSWHAKYLAASKSVDENREAKMEAIGEEIEKDLVLLGGTAIEDRLQQGVPTAISLMRRAGIKLWVLTGDKVETAISIGFSCNLLSNEMELLVIRGDGKGETDEKNPSTEDDPCSVVASMLANKFGLSGTPEDIEAARKDHSTPQQTSAVVVDGRALAEIMADEVAQRRFLLLCKRCSSVICCRVSPAQKAEIVKMVKDGLKVMTLAIGDGANDVSMIQTANVGVGIAGQEGRQAAMSSDYSIGQFRFLARLLLVHGRWAYRRFAEMIPCFFYKNVVFVFPLFWYGIFVNFDGTYLYEYSYLMIFNLFFTSVPVITMGCLDQDVSSSVSLAVPELYRVGVINSEWSIKKFTHYMLEGMYQSFVVFFFTWFLYWQGVFNNQNGLNVDYRFWLGVYCAHVAVLSCNTFVLFRQYRWDWLTLLFSFLSFAILVFWTGVWTASVTSSTSFYKAAPECYGTVSFWAILAIGTLCCLLPRIVEDTINQAVFPKDIDIVREQVRKGKFAGLPEDYDPTSPQYAALAAREGAASELSETSESSMGKGDLESGEQVATAPASGAETPSTRNRGFSIKKMMGLASFKKNGHSALGRIKAEMERTGQSSPRSSIDGIRTSADLGLSTPANLMRVYTSRSTLPTAAEQQGGDVPGENEKSETGNVN